MRRLLAISCLASFVTAGTSGYLSAEDCTATGPGCAGATQSVTQGAIQRRLDRMLAATPDGHIQKRLQGNAWEPGANGASPWNIAPSGDITDFSTSLSQWGSWVVRSDGDKVGKAKEALPAGTKLPAAPAVDHNFDIWTQTRVITLKDGVGRESGEALTGYVGTDYAPLDGVVVGGLVQFDSTKEGDQVLHGTLNNEGYLAGPYVAVRLAPGVTFDGKLGWGAATDTLRNGLVADSYETSRRLAQARLKGEWSWAGWQFAPVTSLQIVEENGVSQFRDLEAAAGFRSVSVHPRLSRRMQVDDDKTIEPFVHFNSSLDLDTAGALLQGQAGQEVRPTNSVGGGVTLSQQDEFTLNATTDVEGVGGEGETNLRGTLNLKVPLP